VLLNEEADKTVSRWTTLIQKSFILKCAVPWYRYQRAFMHVAQFC